MSLKRRQLREFCRIVQGGRHGLSGNDFVTDGFPAYGAGGLNGLLPNYEFDEAAVVLSSIGARCGKCFYVDGKWASLANTQIIIPDPSEANARFLWYQLNDEASWHRSGTGQPFIKPADVKSRSVYLPPLMQQRRIADVLDRADKLRAIRGAALNQLEDLAQSLFLEFFGDPALNPKKWPMLPMVELFVAPPVFGTMIPATTNGGSWLSLRVANIRDWQLDLSDQKFVDLPQDMAQRYEVRDGDLLMARAIASQEHLGKAVVVNPGDRKWAFDSHLMRLRFNCSKAEPEFIRHLLMTNGGRSLFLRAARRSAVQFNINTKEISALCIPVAPIELQRTFARCVATLGQVRRVYSSSLAEMGSLFDSIRSRAFRGQL